MSMYAYTGTPSNLYAYEDYYKQQAGGGINQYFKGGAQFQRGRGIGSFLGGLFRAAVPLLKRGGLAIGKELLNSGARVLGDIGDGIGSKEALRNRMGEAVGTLKTKATNKVIDFLHGRGLKRRRRRKKTQSTKTSRSGKSSSKVKSRIVKKGRRKKKKKTARSSVKPNRRRSARKKSCLTRQKTLKRKLKRKTNPRRIGAKSRSNPFAGDIFG